MTARVWGTRRSERPLRVVCLAETALGHSVFVQNLRRHLGGANGSAGALAIDWVAFAAPAGDYADRFAWLRRHPALAGSARAMGALFGLRVWPDVLFFHTPTIAQLALPLMGTIPTILSLDSTPRQFADFAAAYGARAPDASMMDRASHRLNGAVFRAARALLPWSEWAARSLRWDYGVGPERVTINPPGVDLPERFGPRVAVANRPIKVLFVGGDFARKGGFLLVEALQTLALPWELHLVTRDETPRASNIRAYGALDNQGEAYAALFRSCDLFALPTLADCHSIATIEAMAAGLPVISTTVGGIPEIVVDGQTGFLTAPGDRQALRLALSRLMVDTELRLRMGAAGRRRAEARFDARERAGTVRRVIEALADRPRLCNRTALIRTAMARTEQ